MKNRNYRKLSLLAVATLSSVACVQTTVARRGRMPLTHGTEGRTPIVPDDYSHATFDEVATILIEAQGVNTLERRARHLVRRASLLGCDAVARVQHTKQQSKGLCLRRREPKAPTKIQPWVIGEAPITLFEKAELAGAEGMPLLRALRSSRERLPHERAWPLRWFLKHYPDSPFRPDVEALFKPVNASMAAAPTSVRTAPSLK